MCIKLHRSAARQHILWPISKANTALTLQIRSGAQALGADADAAGPPSFGGEDGWRDAASGADQMKRQFVHLLAHESFNPVTRLKTSFSPGT